MASFDEPCFLFFWGEHKYIVLMLASITINYGCGIFIHVARNRGKYVRRAVLALSVALNLGVLFWYKYLDFAICIVNSAFNEAIPLKNIALPIGISFFTFQGMTYIIDLYRGVVSVQKNPLKVALYISLFPQLIAGPIVRYKDVASQIDSRIVTLDKFYLGVTRFIVGLGKKTIIANNLALIADNVFNQPIGSFPASTAWLGVISYAFQIYFDFSGYSDMAIGLGRLFGFDFLENFNYPYISSSIREFWRRWHISLSAFFRDYLYIPLGGSKKGNVYVHLIIVFLATGLWHGASVNFVLWGLWHGLFKMIERLCAERLRIVGRGGAVQEILRHFYAALVVLLGWVFFRSANISYAVSYIKVMLGLWANFNIKVSAWFYINPFRLLILFLALVFSAPVAPWLKKMIDEKFPNNVAIASLRAALFCLVFLVSCVMIMNSNYNPFIYFRF
jgi:alginate O-acetyltransferase complex protein AlgI